MGAVLFIAAAVGLFAWRWGRKLWPIATKVFSWGDDLGGFTMFMAFGGAKAAKRGISGGVRLVLYAIAAIAALVDGRVRLAVAAFVLWRLRGRWLAARAETASLARSGLTAAERDVIHEAMTFTLGAMGLASKGAEPIPPTCFKWTKRPVTVGGKPIAGQWRYQCIIEPAPGRSLPELENIVGRGLDASDDRLRDALNSTLRNMHGRRPASLRKAKMMPGPFVLSTIEHVTRNGEKIGQARLTMWTTDPFRRPVLWPYPINRPVISDIRQPAPVGLLRGNVEAKMKLPVMTAIQGSNGSGKSSVVRPMITAAAWTDAVIIVCALKGSADYAELAERFAGGIVITDPAVAANVARWGNEEISRRNGLTAEQRAAERDVIMLYDEGQELRADIHLLTPNAKKGRSARVWTWLVTQYAPSSVKPEDGGCPTTLLRELKNRAAGRIEGNYSQAEVAVGQRVTKSAGPHLIPADERWNGVIFNNDGAYIRAYWMSCESIGGKRSKMAQLAGFLPPRPPDPPGFLEALRRKPAPITDAEFEAAELAAAEPLSWPEDGAERAADGSAVALTVEATPLEVRSALVTLWPVAGKRVPPSGRLTRATVTKSTAAARARAENLAAQKSTDVDPAVLDALAVVEEFLSHPSDLVVA